MQFDPQLPWYHGSPLELTLLRRGSTITQKLALARIFSHKPTLVSVTDDGQIRHNGILRGYLYAIVDRVQPEDVAPHPYTTMGPGDEWLTTREFHVQLLGRVELLPEEQLTAEEYAAIQEQLAARNADAQAMMEKPQHDQGA